MQVKNALNWKIFVFLLCDINQQYQRVLDTRSNTNYPVLDGYRSLVGANQLTESFAFSLSILVKFYFSLKNFDSQWLINAADSASMVQYNHRGKIY